MQFAGAGRDFAGSRPAPIFSVGTFTMRPAASLSMESSIILYLYVINGKQEIYNCMNYLKARYNIGKNEPETTRIVVGFFHF